MPVQFVIIYKSSSCEKKIVGQPSEVFVWTQHDTIRHNAWRVYSSGVRGSQSYESTSVSVTSRVPYCTASTEDRVVKVSSHADRRYRALSNWVIIFKFNVVYKEHGRNAIK